ncbi:MAG: hypothetical protein HND47_01285 [Chloroflexi bacterium]|nr:hypothetical protein [Chloroflexota bacterium]
MKVPRKRSQLIQEKRRRTARFLFYLNAVVWLVNGAIFISKMIADSNTITAALVAFFFLINVLALVVAARIIDSQEKWVFTAALAITGANTLMLALGLPDILDVVSLAINLIIFANLIPLKSYYYKEA